MAISETSSAKTRLSSKVELVVPYATVLKVFALALLFFALYKLFTILILFFLGTLLAVTMQPAVLKMRRFGLPRWAAIGTIAVVMSLIVGAVAFVLIPSVLSQVDVLIKDLPKYKTDMVANLKVKEDLKRIVSHALDNPMLAPTDELLGKAVGFAAQGLTGLTEFFLVLVFSIYLLIDGPAAFLWIRDFFSAPVRKKLEQTAQETSAVVFSYVVGQGMTSLLCATYVYAVLTVLHVPAALTMGLIAGIFDVVPIIGFLISILPAVVMGLTVNVEAAVLIFVAYVIYHLIESYLIVPWIYGSRLKISSLVVLLTLVMAAELVGIIGALTVLPIVASYPIIERIWLAKYLGRKVVAKHGDDLKTDSASLSMPQAIPDERAHASGTEILMES
jgi:predicted PurR-regulated permease PerM